MGMGSITLGDAAATSNRYNNVHKLFLLCNYLLLGAASACIFLTISLRMIPSICGFFLVLLHVLTIAGAVCGCASASSDTFGWYSAQMVATVLIAIFQGSVSVLIFTRTAEFLGEIKSYVREEDGAVILKLAGGLSALIFCFEWVVLTLAFFLKYYSYVEGGNGRVATCTPKRGTARVHQEDESKNWPWPFQV